VTVDRSNYFQAALTNQYNLILFAGSVSFAAALSSWVPLILGLAGEMLWLVIGPNLAGFRRRVDMLRDQDDSNKAISSLSAEYAERVRAVEREVQEIESLVVSRGGVSSEERTEVSRRLRPLLQGFVDVCSTHQRLRRTLSQGQLGELHAELTSLHQALAGETDLGVRASLRRALTVTERRIKQHEGNEAACRSMEMGISTLQKSLVYLKECAAGVVSLGDLGNEIDAVVVQLNRIAVLEVDREELAISRSLVSPPTLN
jgi:hypothetical protein